MRRSNAGRPAARRLRRLIWIAALAVVACVPPGYRPGPGFSEEIGVLATSGSQVYVNGMLAAPGTAIRNRDSVSTGAASSALVNFRTGGSLQLDANTDPSLSQFWSGLQCVIEIVAGGGDLYAETDPCDCVFRSPEVESTCSSKFAAKVARGRTTIILIAGHMSIRRPVTADLQPFEQIVVARSGIVDRRMLSKSEANDAIAWRYQYKYDRGRKRQGQQGIEVPPLLKYTVTDAQMLTGKLGLGLRLMTGNQVEGVGGQIIVGQDPPPGTIVQPGGIVNVWTEGVIQ
ncbi:MAG: PASTA domain-containing protein [Dongiaceae bacterium]